MCPGIFLYQLHGIVSPQTVDGVNNPIKTVASKIQDSLRFSHHDCASKLVSFDRLRTMIPYKQHCDLRAYRSIRFDRDLSS